jgi:hypothetical protein
MWHGGVEVGLIRAEPEEPSRPAVVNMPAVAAHVCLHEALVDSSGKYWELLGSEKYRPKFTSDLLARNVSDF